MYNASDHLVTVRDTSIHAIRQLARWGYRGQPKGGWVKLSRPCVQTPWPQDNEVTEVCNGVILNVRCAR